jgi:hypothetical protein
MLRKLAAGLLVAALTSLLLAFLYLTTRPGKVSGRVMYDGKPVPIGAIAFHPEGSGRRVTVDIEDGVYRAGKMPVGTVRVTVHTAMFRRSYEAMKLRRQSAGSAERRFPGLVDGNHVKGREEVVDTVERHD